MANAHCSRLAPPKPGGERIDVFGLYRGSCAWSMSFRPTSRRRRQCRDLLNKILVPEPSKRITIPEIQRHPWCDLHSLQFLCRITECCPAVQALAGLSTSMYFALAQPTVLLCLCIMVKSVQTFLCQGQYIVKAAPPHRCRYTEDLPPGVIEMNDLLPVPGSDVQVGTQPFFCTMSMQNLRQPDHLCCFIGQRQAGLLSSAEGSMLNAWCHEARPSACMAALSPKPIYYQCITICEGSLLLMTTVSVS